MDKSNRRSVWAAIVAGSIAAVATAYVITAGIDSLFGSPTEVMIGESATDDPGGSLPSGSAVVPSAPLRVLELPVGAQAPSASGTPTLPGAAIPDAPTTANDQPGISGGDPGHGDGGGDPGHGDGGGDPGHGDGGGDPGDSDGNGDGEGDGDGDGDGDSGDGDGDGDSGDGDGDSGDGDSGEGDSGDGDGDGDSGEGDSGDGDGDSGER